MIRHLAVERRGGAATLGAAAAVDKRFRRSDVRPGRRRRIGRISWLVARGLIVGLVLAGAAMWAVDAALSAQPLAVRHVVIRGNERLSAGEVEAMVADMRGQNIFRVDLGHFDQRLTELPWVAGATLRRVLPGTIEVTVTERRPMAIARVNDQLYLVDDTGVIIDQFGPQYREFDLPIVDGLVEVAGDQHRVEASGAALAARLIATLRTWPAMNRQVSEIDVTDPSDAVILLGDDGIAVHLGEEHLLARLKTYVELAPTLHERLKAIDAVDMRFDDRIYVRSKGQVASVAKD